MKKIVRVPVLNSEYLVIFTYGTYEEVRKVLKKYHYPMEDIKSDHFNGRGVCFHMDGVFPVIAMPDIPRTAEQIGTLAHEAVHAVDDIWKKIGENTSGEAYAHSVGAVVREILSQLGE
jgi:hypothetical protein